MRKFRHIALLFLVVFMLAACTETKDADGQGASKEIDDLVVFFVPSRDTDDITTVTEPLKDLLKEELAKDGYDVKNVDIQVSANYEGAGEALVSGSAHIGFIPAGTYALYSEEGKIDVILAATRDGLNKDSDNPVDWNDNEPTLPVEDQVTYYRSLMFAGPSEKGQELAELVNAGHELTWDDVNSATWCHSSTSSSAGYIYPSLWLSERFDGKIVSDLDNAVLVTSYADTAARLSNEQCDVGVGYADIRRDYADDWTKEWGRENIWEETAIIGVTEGIMNDTISVSNDLVDEELKKSLQKAFIEIAKTEDGKKAIAIYNHSGYEVVTDKDYDASRASLEFLTD